MNLIPSLLKPDAYPHSVNAIKLIETHISWVLLTGQFAYKIKKNVQFDFLDFSTLEKRRFYCEEEVRLNRRFAPELYLQVVPITVTTEQAYINGEGEIKEYAVQMRQFPANQLLSEMTNQGLLNNAIIDQLADLIANFHRRADVNKSLNRYGTEEEIHHWFLGNFIDIPPCESGQFLDILKRLENWGERELLKNTLLIRQRKRQGFIRECHGDLHLGNVALFKNCVTPFDAIEFNPALRWIDVINDVAFLLMDLQQRELSRFAARFLNRYLSQTGDYHGLNLLRYYLVYRALVRTKVALLRWQQHKNPQDFCEAEKYANLAERFTRPEPPFLLITHGYSGSGKSTFSAKLTEQLGIIHLRSDVERQRLFAKLKSADIYSKEHTQKTYQKLADLADSIINAGFSVLIDATFLTSAQRTLFQQLAIKRQVEFLILDFQATQEELKRRIIQRQQRDNDPSEATIAVLQKQIQTTQSLTAAEQEKAILIVVNSIEKYSMFI